MKQTECLSSPSVLLASPQLLTSSTSACCGSEGSFLHFLLASSTQATCGQQHHTSNIGACHLEIHVAIHNPSLSCIHFQSCKTGTSSSLSLLLDFQRLDLYLFSLGSCRALARSFVRDGQLVQLSQEMISQLFNIDLRRSCIDSQTRPVTSDTLNWSSLLLSSTRFVMRSKPLSCNAGSGATAPISRARALHLNHRRMAAGPSLIF